MKKGLNELPTPVMERKTCQGKDMNLQDMLPSSMNPSLKIYVPNSQNSGNSSSELNSL